MNETAGGTRFGLMSLQFSLETFLFSSESFVSSFHTVILWKWLLSAEIFLFIWISEPLPSSSCYCIKHSPLIFKSPTTHSGLQGGFLSRRSWDSTWLLFKSLQKLQNDLTWLRDDAYHPLSDNNWCVISLLCRLHQAHYQAVKSWFWVCLDRMDSSSCSPSNRFLKFPKSLFHCFIFKAMQRSAGVCVQPVCLLYDTQLCNEATGLIIWMTMALLVVNTLWRLVTSCG